MARSARFATVLVAALLPAVAGGAEPPQPDPPGAVAPGLPEPAPPPVWIRDPFSVQGPVPPEGPQGGACLVGQPAHGAEPCTAAADCTRPPIGGSYAYCAPDDAVAGDHPGTCWYRPGPAPGDGYCLRGVRPGTRTLYTPTVNATAFWSPARWRVVTCENLAPPFADADGETRPACANGLSVEGQHKRTRYGTPARFP